MAGEERKIFLNSPISQNKSRQMSFAWPLDSTENVQPNQHPGEEIKEILTTFYKCVQTNTYCEEMMKSVVEVLKNCDIHDFEKMSDVCGLFNRTVAPNFALTLDMAKDYYSELIDDFFSKHIIDWSLSRSFPAFDETYIRPFFDVAGGVLEILSSFFESKKKRQIVHIGCEAYSRPVQFTGVEIDNKVSLLKLQELGGQYHKRMLWFGKKKNILEFITCQSFLDNNVLQVVEQADVMVLDPREYSDDLKEKLRTEIVRIFGNGMKKQFYLISIGEMFDFMYSHETSNLTMESMFADIGRNGTNSDAVYCLKLTIQSEAADTSHSSLATSVSDMGEQSDGPSVSRKKRKSRHRWAKGYSYGSQKRRKVSNDDTQESSTLDTSTASSQIGSIPFSPEYQILAPVQQDLPVNILDFSAEQTDESGQIPMFELNSFVDTPPTIPSKQNESGELSSSLQPLQLDLSTSVNSAVFDNQMKGNEIGVAGPESVSEDAVHELKPFPEAELCSVTNCGVTLDFGHGRKMTLCPHGLRHHLTFFDQVLANGNIKEYTMEDDMNVVRFKQFLRSVYKPATSPIQSLHADPLPDDPKELIEIIALAFEYQPRSSLIPAFQAKIYQSGLWSAAASDKAKLFNLAFEHKQQTGPEFMAAAIKVAFGIPVKKLMSMAIGSVDLEKKNLICKITKLAYSDIASPFSWEEIKSIEMSQF